MVSEDYFDMVHNHLEIYSPREMIEGIKAQDRDIMTVLYLLRYCWFENYQ